MSTAADTTSLVGAEKSEFVTFRVGDALMGVDILQAEEINRHIEATNVPHAPEYVRGVINLRGDVVTVIDLCTILGLPTAELTKQTRTVVVRSKGEQIGLLVDRIADVVEARSDEIDPPPANMGSVEGRYYHGVYKLDTELLILLNIDAVLAVQAATR